VFAALRRRYLADGWFLFVFFFDRDGIEREPASAPGVQAALQRANMLDALFSEEERHTGARSFVWSSAVEDDFTIVGQKIVFFLELLGVHAESAGDGLRVCFEIQGMT